MNHDLCIYLAYSIDLNLSICTLKAFYGCWLSQQFPMHNSLVRLGISEHPAPDLIAGNLPCLHKQDYVSRAALRNISYLDTTILVVDKSCRLLSLSLLFGTIFASPKLVLSCSL